VSVVKAPHLRAAAAALLIGAAVLFSRVLYARTMEARYIHALAPQFIPQKYLGSALQREAFRQPDLLPVYGSSELLSGSPFHPSKAFEHYPTGFTIFPVANKGVSCLILLQKLAALRGEARNRRLVVSLTNDPFFVPSINSEWYGGNFSLLHAYELAFSSELSFPLRQAAAERMLAYPGTLKDPVLRYALESLAEDTLPSHILYAALWPLAKARIVILRLQDHEETLRTLAEQKDLDAPISHEQATLEWEGMLQQADAYAKTHADNNRFGLDSDYWLRNEQGFILTPDPSTGGEYVNARRAPPIIRNLVKGLPETASHKEWLDLDLLLRALNEMGARPLIVSAPLCGCYCDYLAVPFDARCNFYSKLRRITADYGIPLVDFAGHDGDIGFVSDLNSHASAAGFVHYARVMDAYYHDDLPRAYTESPLANKQSTRSPVHPVAFYDGGGKVMNDRTIAGWAWDYRRPDKPLELDISVDGKSVGTITADQMRNDLLYSGKGNGRHGFSWTLPEALADGLAHQTRVTIARTSMPILESVDVFSRAQASVASQGLAPPSKTSPAPPLPKQREAAAPTTPASAERVYESSAVVVDGTMVGGWAWDRDRPDAPLQVQVSVDGKVVETVTADRLRKDLADAGKGNGRHGFLWSVPVEFRDGRPHQIKLIVLNTAKTIMDTLATFKKAGPPA
jgi:D-alanine transfer protein